MHLYIKHTTSILEQKGLWHTKQYFKTALEIADCRWCGKMIEYVNQRSPTHRLKDAYHSSTFFLMQFLLINTIFNLLTHEHEHWSAQSHWWAINYEMVNNTNQKVLEKDQQTSHTCFRCEILSLSSSCSLWQASISFVYFWQQKCFPKLKSHHHTV